MTHAEKIKLRKQLFLQEFIEDIRIRLNSCETKDKDGVNIPFLHQFDNCAEEVLKEYCQ